MNIPAQQIPFRKLLTTRESIILFCIWVVITLFVFLIFPWSEFVSSWVTTIPAGWLLYHVSFRWLFPKAHASRFPLLLYVLGIAGYCFVIFFTQSIILSMYIEQEDFFIGMGGITVFILFCIQMPVQWFVFKRMARNHEELFVLQKELGQTEASADMLRAQINPHFLFNVLNTLYGLALHEKATRTSEAIEKLGSMMRFMLQENLQEKILLVRDLEYLNDYLVLQRLRTGDNPNIKIQTTLPEEVDPSLQIAPMLLIPFIENAFKHGIRFREESYIRISVELKQSTLYFDVFNTKHIRTEGDPEKNSNGIGLQNVKQRLNLMYPDKHELVIRETAHDYFVHLVITLAS